MPQEIQAGLADILQPALPGPDVWLSSLLPYAITLMVLVAILAALRWLKTPRGRARVELTLLRLRVPHDCREPRLVAYDIARIVSSGIGVNGLGTRTKLPAALHDGHSYWTDFISLLDQARYRSKRTQANELDHLFRHACYWLRHWP